MEQKDEKYPDGKVHIRSFYKIDELGRRYLAESQEYNEDSTFKNVKFYKSVKGEGVLYQEKEYDNGLMMCVKFYKVDSGRSRLERIDKFDGKVKVQTIEIYKTIDSTPVLDRVEDFTYYKGQTAVLISDVDIRGNRVKKQRTFKDPENDQILRVEFIKDDQCVMEYIYDDDGKRVEVKNYEISENGERFMKKHTYLDSNGNQRNVEVYEYAGEGKVAHTESIEYERNEDNSEIITTIYYPYQEGKVIRSRQVGKLPDNKPLIVQIYDAGILKQESKYEYDEFGINTTRTVTIYQNEDGKAVPVRTRIYRMGELMEDTPIME